MALALRGDEQHPGGATLKLRMLGAPGPENLASPVLSTSSLPTSLIDPSASTSSAPVKQLRFRVIDVTTRPAPAGTADMRAVTSQDITVTRADGESVLVKGTALEQEALQPAGGGFNSTLKAGHITLDRPLAAGETVNVQFLLGVQQGGKFRFFITVEAK